MDDFERAVLVLYDQSEGNSELKERAFQYLETLKHSTGWMFCAQKFFEEAYSSDTTRFVCLQTAEEGISQNYEGLEESSKLALRGMMMKWIRDNGTKAEAPYIRNKLAQLFIAIFLVEFPATWPTFFTDIIDLFSYGETAIDMFIRILDAIDGIVVDREVARTEQQTILHSNLKDAMRTNALEAIADAWYNISANHASMNNVVISSCLETVAKYISWIDIRLIVNERFITLLFEFMSNDEQREHACECFIALVAKGMDALVRADMIKSLNLVQMVRITAESLGDEADDFTMRLATLAAAIGSETCKDIIKSKEVGADLSLCYDIVDQSLPLLFMFLMHADIDVSLEVLPFAQDYLQLLKNGGQGPTAEQAERLKLLTQYIILKMRYPLNYNFKNEGENEIEFMDYRKDLRAFFDQIHKMDPSGTLSVVVNTVSSTVDVNNLPNAAFADVEIALELVVAIGETFLNIKDSKEFATSPVVQPFVILFQSNVGQCSHKVVLIKYLEVLDRYSRYFTVQSAELPRALAQFLGDFGLRHRNSSVRSWASSRLVRFLKEVRTIISNELSSEIIHSIKDFLSVDLRQDFSLSFDDRLYVFESAAMIIVLDGADATTQVGYMSSLIDPLLASFSQIVDRELPLAATATDQEKCVDSLHFIIAAVTRLSKGFNLSSFQTSGCNDIFSRALVLFINALRIPVFHKIIHGATRTFLHRMIVCMGEGIVQFLPAAITELINMERSQVSDLEEFIPLINQIVAKFGGAVASILSDIFVPFLQGIFAVLQQEVDPTDLSLQQELNDLRKAYFSFINTVAIHLQGIFTTESNAPYFPAIITSLVQGASDVSDPISQRSCFQAIKKLVTAWIPGVEQSLFTEIVPLTFEVFTKLSFDVDDGKTWLNVVEIGGIHKAILERYQQEYIDYLKGIQLPGLGLTAAAIDEFADALVNMEKNTFSSFLRAYSKRNIPRR